MGNAPDTLAQPRQPNGPPPSPSELRAITIFADLPEEGLDWLAQHMKTIELAPGELLLAAGAPAEYLTVILAGEIRAERNDGRVFIASAGQVTGLLPFSRLTQYPSDIRAVSATRLATLHKDLFSEMNSRLPALQGRLVNLMADRIREATAADQQREKMMALGKLSAGLAHELNNPASAARRAADTLRKSLHSVRAAAVKLDRDGLPLESRVFLSELESEWARNALPHTVLDTLDRSDREDEIAEWLRAQKVEAVWDLAPTLVDVGCTLETLEAIPQHVPARFLNDVLIRLTAAFTISRLADEIESATGRISELVRAIKEYSYMDQTAQQTLDIHSGLENTLLMLRHRLKKGIEVVLEYDRTLPKLSANGGELNQVWTNLIVNAADAMPNGGKLTIRTQRDHNCVRVEVVDTGSGIPKDIQSRIFEPFFTTKPVGEGTGLGLDIVARIVRNHRGDVSFTSAPGETKFVVRLPFAQRAA